MKPISQRVRLTLGGLLLASLFCLIASVQFAAVAGSTPAFRGDRASIDAALAAVNEGDTEAWDAARAPFETDKWSKVDAAEGWGVLAAAFGVASSVGFWRAARGGSHPFTPRYRVAAPLVMVIAAGAQVPLIAYYFATEVSERKCCPWWADSAAIPIFEMLVVVFAYLVFFELVSGVLLVLGRAPGALLALGSPTLTRQLIGTVMALVLVVLSALLLVGGLSSQPSLVALGFCGIWAAFVARSTFIAGPKEVVTHG